jgi:hypothetical protein
MMVAKHPLFCAYANGNTRPPEEVLRTASDVPRPLQNQWCDTFAALINHIKDRIMLKDKVKLNPGEELKFESSHSKGFMAEEDINEYSVVNSEGLVVGKVKHTDHTAVRGFRRTQTVRQTDLNGTVIVDEHWEG